MWKERSLIVRARIDIFDGIMVLMVYRCETGPQEKKEKIRNRMDMLEIRCFRSLCGVRSVNGE